MMTDENKEVSTVVSPRFWKMPVPPEPAKFIPNPSGKPVHDDLIIQLMGIAISPPGQVNFELVGAYRDQFLLDAGAPTDPLERVMIEQVATCHAMLMYNHSYATM